MSPGLVNSHFGPVDIKIWYWLKKQIFHKLPFREKICLNANGTARQCHICKNNLGIYIYPHEPEQLSATHPVMLYQQYWVLDVKIEI